MFLRFFSLYVVERDRVKGVYIACFLCVFVHILHVLGGFGVDWFCEGRDFGWIPAWGSPL